MAFPNTTLVPSGGQILAHIFENRHTGLARGLFWSISIKFEPISYGGDEYSCSMMCEWIPWRLRNWLELDGRRLSVDYGEEGIESSFYLTEHDIGTHTELALRHQSENLFETQVKMVVDFYGFHNGDENPQMQIDATVALPFLGVLVIPDNLFPKPTTEQELRDVAADFIDLTSFRSSEPWMTHGSIFPPKF
ncbi:hypothetical protein Enr10x_28870 [Gimesia panareensis]|uniref:Uncharacterized protein n=1 Tax=Gimesia panareensis TaxID=2527978 RepID=A0A517Q7G5_9PLAN|nr:hypothetical protein [Gimesia panareensis]QDT27569.1 hypothetical protein Enr10x_28870 [Gimesia panareensis]